MKHILLEHQRDCEALAKTQKKLEKSNEMLKKSYANYDEDLAQKSIKEYLISTCKAILESPCTHTTMSISKHADLIYRTYNQMLTATKTQLLENVKELKKEKAFIYVAKEEIEKLNMKILALKKELEKRSLENSKLKKVILETEKLDKNLHKEDSDYYFSEMSFTLENLKENLKKHVSYLHDTPIREELLTKKKILTTKRIKADNAYESLSELRSAREYTADFLNENIDQISSIFLALHTPREFSKLFLKNQILVGQRGKKDVPINEMSTGQRTAVALSVFLTLNSQTDTAPNFILLDEPVANIDDLNVLSLLDFLRELTIKYDKQIFFTTANLNISKLLRRKFSFMEDDFQEMYFYRNSNIGTSTKLREYSQTKLENETEIEF